MPRLASSVAAGIFRTVRSAGTQSGPQLSLRARPHSSGVIVYCDLSSVLNATPNYQEHSRLARPNSQHCCGELSVFVGSSWTQCRNVAISSCWPTGNRPLAAAGRSGVRPTPKEIVIDAGEGDHGGVLGDGLLELLPGGAEFEQQGAVGVRAHHALNPEKRPQPGTPRHRRDLVDAG